MNKNNKIIKVRSDENYYCYDWIFKSLHCFCIHCFKEWRIESPEFTAESIFSGYWTLKILNIPGEASIILLKTNMFNFNNYKLRISARKVNGLINCSSEYSQINLSQYNCSAHYFKFSAKLKFINFSLLNNCTYLTHERDLTLVVELFGPVSMTPTVVRNLTNIEMAFKNLQLSEELSDVTLVTGEREFRAHKAILAAQSSVFLAMFKHDVKETNENRVVIEDVSERVMEQVLDYIYGGTVEKENFEVLASEVLVAADKYNLQGLVRICEDALISSLNVDNVLKILTIAEDYKLNSLKESALNFFVKNVKEVVEPTDEFKKLDSLSHSLMKEIILAIYQ